jgi:hypothetical protein
MELFQNHFYHGACCIKKRFGLLEKSLFGLAACFA